MGRAELRKVLGAMGARVTEVELAVGHAHDKFDDDGALVTTTFARLAEGLATLLAEAPPCVLAASSA